MRGDRIPLSHLLPIIDLALLALLVFVPITVTSLHLYQASKGSSRVQIDSGQFDLTLPRDQIVPLAIRMVTVSKAHTIMAINLPGIIVQALISLPMPRTFSWHPAALLLDTWRALVFPFFCLPFWWLVGRGVDGLLSKDRLHWSLVLVGTVLFAICLVAVLAFHFGTSSALDRQDLAWVMPGFTGWTIAFAILPIAWIVQSLRPRRPID